MSKSSDKVPNCRRLEGKIALVTAATAGIGLGIVTRLAQEGAHVVLCSRKAANVDATVASLQARNLSVSGMACHVGDSKQIQDLISFVERTHGRLDILVSNAAVNPTSGPILHMDESALDKILDVNIKSAVLLAKYAVPIMPKGSCLVFVSSYSAYNPMPPIAFYAVSKTALIGLTKALAEELGPHEGIRVNCVAPGIVPTKFAAALVDSKEAEEVSVSKTLLGRLGTPGEIASAVAFLCSEDASYVTGETLVVAGGMQSRL